MISVERRKSMNTIVLTANSPSIAYLCKKDKRLAKLISTIGDITYNTHSDDPYSFIVHEIIEQMLSIKAGAKIYSRFEDLCKGNITPDVVNSLSIDQIRTTGTSSNKATYIKEFTSAVLSGKLNFEELNVLTDKEVIKKLTSIKGIGNWTAKMYLIFVLDRQNILPIEDAAFLQSFCWLYKMNNPTKNDIIKKCSKWSPYSSIASRYLYRALDTGLTKQEFHLYK